MRDFSRLWQFNLTRGGSSNPRHGACVMDAVSWFEYGTLGDAPPCTCPVQASAFRAVNDALPWRERQQLRRYIPRLIGTVDRRATMARSRYLTLRAATVHTPLALEFRGLTLKAAALRLCTNHEEIRRFAAEYYRHAFNPVRFVLKEIDGEPWRTGTYIFGPQRLCWYPVHAHSAIRKNVRQAMFETLDGLLAIGKQSAELDPARARIAIEQFAAARGEKVMA